MGNYQIKEEKILENNHNFLTRFVNYISKPYYKLYEYYEKKSIEKQLKKWNAI